MSGPQSLGCLICTQPSKLFKRLLAKLDDLVWVQCKLLSQLSQRLIPFQSGYRHLGSKLGRKRSSWSSHRRCSLALCASMNSDLLSIIDLSQKAGPALQQDG
jgi:hypothetical protein